MRVVFQYCLGLLLFWMSAVHADVRIVITDGVNTARPIAVVPFQWTGVGSAPEGIENIIASDLRNSGKFNPVEVSRMPQQPARVSDVEPAAWAAMGIDSIVIGSIQPGADGKYLVNYQLVDTVNLPGEVLMQNQFLVTKRWLRYSGHTASDEIFEKLTGIKGAFRTRLAYVVRSGNNGRYTYELRVSDYDGRDQVTVHRSSEPLMSPTWSPDGTKLAFSSFEGRRSTLMLKTLSSGVLEKLSTYPGHNGAPAFSPDGSKLAFASSKTGTLNLYVMDLMTRQIRPVTNSRSNNTEPSWMADNRTLVYTSDQAGRPQLYTTNINDGTSKRLTWEGRQNQNPALAPDDSFIAMVTTSESRAQHIAKLDLASGAMQVLTSTFIDETPSIAPNGTMIIYSSTDGYKNVLNLVSSDGRFKAKLPATDGDIKFPAWSPYL